MSSTVAWVFLGQVEFAIGIMGRTEAKTYFCQASRPVMKNEVMTSACLLDASFLSGPSPSLT